MGKIIAKRIRGMNLWAKVALTVLFTFALSVFMYEGWYKPHQVQAATVTYQAYVPDTSTSLGADGTCNTTSGAPNSVTANLKDTLSTTITSTASRYHPTTGLANGTTTSVAKFYGPVYASNTAITAPSASVAIRGYNTTDAWTFHLYEYDPAGAAGNKRLLATSSTIVSGTGSTVAAAPTYTLDANNVVASGHRLMMEITYKPGGTTLTPRIYLDGTSSTSWTRLTVTETAVTNPTVTSVSPSSMAQGAGPTNVTITGTGFNAGATVVFSGTGITTGTVTVNSSTSITVPVTVSSSAATGARNVTVTNTNTGSGTGTGLFTVTTAVANPTVVSTSPSSMTQGTGPTTVTITGTGFKSGATVAFSGTGITTGTVTYVNTTTLTVPVTVASSAATGARNVTVTNTDTGSGTGTGVFTVAAAVVNPTVVSTSPSSMTQGTGPTTVTITGTGFQSGATVAFSGTGITTGTVSYVNATTLTVPVTVAAGATTGARNVTVTNPDTGTGTGTGLFTVNAAATCTAAAPSMTIAPSSATVPVNGNNIYTVSVTNNDSAACSATTFNLALANSNTVSFTSSVLSTTSLNLAAGASGSATFTITVKSGVADGTTNTSTISMSGATPTHILAPNATAVTTVGTPPSSLMHTSANLSTKYGTWGTTFTCATCHIESSGNVKLVANTVSTPNGPRSVVFSRMTATSNTQDGVFGNDARQYPKNASNVVIGSTNICEVCHRKTTYHLYSSNNATHYNNRLCLTCHSHTTGFKPSGHTVPFYADATGHTGCASGIGCHANSNPSAPYPNAGSAPDCRSCHAKADPTTANIGCGSCHGAAGGTGEPNGTTHPDAVGSHPKHTPLATCKTCHDVGGTGGNADHGKGNRGTNPAIVNLASTLNWSSSTSVCSNASCHANVYGTGVTPTPAWGTAAGCGACHTAYPITSTGPATGSHPKHGNFACTNCHAAGTTSTSSPTTGHADGTITLTATGYPATVAKHAANTGYSTSSCTNTCHGSPYAAGTGSSPQWGTTAGCGACHNGVGAFITYSATTQQTGPNTGSHSAHMNYGRYICDECHTGAVSVIGGTSNTGGNAHGDGDIDVTNQGYPANVIKHTAGSGYSTCTAACHITTTWGLNTLRCIDCHAAAITRTKGRPGTQLAAVTAEFGLAWGHKKTGRTAVTDADCIVCHLEGDYKTQKTSKFHADGNIDLRDPDGAGEVAITNISGAAFTFQRFSTSYAAGARSATGHTSNTDIANVITQKFCLACHDNNGAINTTARSNNGGTGTATMPFGGINLGTSYSVVNGAAVAGGLVDVKTEFATTNSSYHPVTGPLNRDYPTAARMNDPYKPAGTRGTSGTLTASVVINCFDCHNQVGAPLTLRTVAAHGNAVTIRGTATVSGTPSSTNYATLCRVCHAGYEAATSSTAHTSGSAFNSSVNSGMTVYLQYGCNVCHGSAYTGVVRPVRAQDVHGVNALPTGGSASLTGSRWAGASTGTPAQVNAKPYAFIRNTKDLGTHNPKKIGGSTYTPQCEMGPNGVNGPTCSNQGLQNYTPGGSF